MVLSRHYSKSQLNGLTKSFTSWKDHTAVFKSGTTLYPFDPKALLADFNDFFQSTIASDQILSLSNFFDKAKSFL